MILDVLHEFEVVAKPANLDRRIGWCSIPLGDVPEPLFESRETLYLFDSATVENGLRQHNASPALLVLRPDEPFDPSDPTFSRALEKRLIVIRGTSASEASSELAFVQAKLQLAMFRLAQWQTTLLGIVKQGGTVQEIVDASESVFQNFIDISDSTYSLIAYTRNIAPADPLSQRLVSLGCHDRQTMHDAEGIDAFTEWRDQRSVEIFPPDSTVPHPYITSVMRVDDAYAGHTVMVCNNHLPTPGLVDLFSDFAEICRRVIEKTIWQEKPQSVFMRKLLSDPRINQAYLEEQAHLLGIEPIGEFVLVSIDYHVGEFSEQPMWLLSLLAKEFPEGLTCRYEDNLLMLLHRPSPDIEKSLGNREKLAAFCERQKCVAYASEPFDRLRHLRFAYRQVLLTRKYKSCIDIELRPLNDIDQRRILSFGEAFCFYCHDEQEADPDFRSFCISHTVLDRMAESEADHSVGDVRLLYHYLFNERKSTPTATQLHMHRNNVLYRIGAIEKKYGLDLSRFETRQHLLSCYRIKILTSARFRKLLT